MTENATAREPPNANRSLLHDANIAGGQERLQGIESVDLTYHSPQSVDDVCDSVTNDQTTPRVVPAEFFESTRQKYSVPGLNSPGSTLVPA